MLISLTSFSFWREPIPDVDLTLPATSARVLSEEEMDALNSYLATRSYVVKYSLSHLDTALAKVVQRSNVDAKLCHLTRWLKHVSSYKDLEGGITVDVEEAIQSIVKGIEPECKEAGNKNSLKNELEVDSCSTGEEMHTADEYLGDYDENYHDAEEYEESDSEEGSDGATSSDDGGGWITPGNLKEKKRQMGALPPENVPKIKVACMTTDFAMQNVLKQLGLQIMSVNGLIIKQTKTWILRCYACYKTTPLMHKQFCPKHGSSAATLATRQLR